MLVGIRIWCSIQHLLADPQGRDNVILVADIGGTNCRFELWQTPEGGGQKLLEKVTSAHVKA